MLRKLSLGKCKKYCQGTLSKLSEFDMLNYSTEICIPRTKDL